MLSADSSKRKLSLMTANDDETRKLCLRHHISSLHSCVMIQRSKDDKTCYRYKARVFRVVWFHKKTNAYILQ